MMACEHCSHPLWAGIKCSQCGRWYDECRTCGNLPCEECMKAEPSEALKQTWADYQEAIKRFECPRCGHHCSQPEQDWSLLEATQEALREHMAEIRILRAALEQPEQEPVAWVNPKHLQGLTLGLYGYAEIYTDESQWRVPLYTHPPRREWQGLTDEERRHIYATTEEFGHEIALAVEAALKEKNHE